MAVDLTIMLVIRIVFATSAPRCSSRLDEHWKEVMICKCLISRSDARSVDVY